MVSMLLAALSSVALMCSALAGPHPATGQQASEQAATGPGDSTALHPLLKPLPSAEVEALMAFMDQYPVHMIQWRNLNFDPNRYLEAMSSVRTNQRPMGIGEALQKVKKAYPWLRYGYFNPPKESWNK